MRYRQMGPDGPRVSVIGLGASGFGRVCDAEQSRAILDAALAAGINFIDTAEAYPGSEDLLGAALRGRRGELVLCSKFGHPANHPIGARASRQVVRTSIEGTLRRLRTDYVDLYYQHMPDPRTPIEETLSALRDVVQQGLVRYIGVSNSSGADIKAFQTAARIHDWPPLTCVQNAYSLLDRVVEHDVLPACRSEGIILVPHTPLAAGLLTGRFSRGASPAPGSRLATRGRAIDDATFAKLERLEQFARERDRSLLELAIGWLSAQPYVGPVITGATTPEQISTNAAAADWVPTPEDLVAVDEFALV